MKYHPLGTTDLSVSAVGLGTWSMGGRWWGDVDDSESVATIHKALDLGINFIDTADIYGFGHSEKLLGQALAERRKEVVIATKVGLRWNNKGKIRNDLSRSYILQQIDESLARLNTDYIDLYQVHWPDPNTSVEETMTALTQCVDAGKVRYLGASNLTVEQLAKYRKYGDIVSLQPPLNLFERQAELQLLPTCLRENVGVLVYSPLCRGLLSGKFKSGHEIDEPVRKRDPFFSGSTFEKNLRIVEHLNKLAGEYKKSVAQLALAWVLTHSAVRVALCGARKSEQIAESAEAADWRLEHRTLEQIEKILVTTV